MMCSPLVSWPQLLPTVLLGLRTAYKEDLRASPAEMLYGTALRVPGEFFVTRGAPACPQGFAEKLSQHMQSVRPVPTNHHCDNRAFIFKDLSTCSHVFRRVDTVRRPLEPPYADPYEVVRRVNDRVFIIRIGTEEKSVSADCLKPAHIAQDGTAAQSPRQQSPPLPARQVSQQLQQPTSQPLVQPATPATTTARRVTFTLPSPPRRSLGGE